MTDDRRQKKKGLTIALFGVMAVIVFGAVPGFQAADGHNFTAYYLFAMMGVCLLPVHWSVKLFAGTTAASCVWLQVMIANVTPRELANVYLRLYLSANSDFQFVLLFIGLYAMVIFLDLPMRSWLEFLCWVALIEVTRISCQRLGWDPVLVPVNASVTIRDAAGSQGNYGWTGMVLAMCVPGFLRPGRWWGLVPVGLALIVQQSLTPAIAGAGAIITIAWIRFRGQVRVLCVLWAILGAVLYWNYDPGDSARFANWARGFDLSWQGRESWFLGYGLGSWIFLFPEPGTSFHRAHCEPLQVYFELGFMGVAAMLLYARFVILRVAGCGLRVAGSRSEEAALAFAGLVTVILCGLGNFPFHLAGTAAIAVGWMAVFEKTTRLRSVELRRGKRGGGK